MSENDQMELYKKHRPRKLSEVVGQEHITKQLIDQLKRGAVPHTILLSGPSGCGKTTIARILRRRLKCSDSDFQELNCSDFRGIEMVRDIRSRCMLSPIDGECRIWLIDEAQLLTKDAQNAFLKLLEDTPSHVYFFIATTEPQKLLVTIKTRATEFKVKTLNDKQMAELLLSVCGKEELTVTEEVRDKVIESAEGSPRKALVLLNQVMGLKDETEQLASIAAGMASKDAIELARILIKPRVQWGDVAKVLSSLDDLDNQAESIRYLVLAYMSSIALKGGKIAGRACEVIACFSRNFFDSRKAGLILACWDAVNPG